MGMLLRFTGMLGVGLVALTVISTAPAQTQDAAWTAWLAREDRVLAVRPDGSASEYTLPPLSDGTKNIGGVILSTSGRYALYFDASATPWQYVVYDLTEQRTALTHPIETRIWEAALWQAGPQNFDPAETRVVFGYTEYNPDLPPDDSIGPWHLLMYDLQTGALLQRLDGDSPAVPLPCPTCTPAVRTFARDQIILAFTRLGMEDTITAFEWDLQTGMFARTPGYEALHLDVLPATGEGVYVRADERFTPPIALYAVTGAGERCFPIVNSLETDFRVDPRFVRGGTQVLFLRPLQSPVQADTAWEMVIVDRRGAQVLRQPLPAAFDPYSSPLAGTPDGFVYLPNRGDQLIHVAPTNGFAEQVIWNSRVGGIVSEGWRLLHVQSTMPTDALPEWTPVMEGECGIPFIFSSG